MFYDYDGNIAVLRDQMVAIIGYGNQGRAQALNLRDSGVPNILVGSIQDASWSRAKADGFPVFSIPEAVKRAEVILILVPDEEQPRIFTEEIEPNLAQGKTLCFASGYNISYELIKPSQEVDVIMVAPRMIGQAVRDLFTAGAGFPAFVDVAQNISGHAWETALAITKGIGALKEGSMAVTFAQEAWMDLLTEQAVWPLILHVLEGAFKVQVEAGLPAEAVLLEMYVSKEPAEIFTRAAEAGLFEQMHLHSRTSQYGQMTAMTQMHESFIEGYIKETLRDRIQSGEFAKEWANEQHSGMKQFDALWQQLLNHPMTLAEKELQAKLKQPLVKGANP